MYFCGTRALKCLASLQSYHILLVEKIVKMISTTRLGMKYWKVVLVIFAKKSLKFSPFRNKTSLWFIQCIDSRYTLCNVPDKTGLNQYF